MRYSEKFEQLHKNKIFLAGIAVFHIFAVLYFFWQLEKRQHFTYHDVIVTTNIMLLLFYWKSFAKMKKKNFD